MDFEQKVLNEVNEAISTAIRAKLEGYNSPLKLVVDTVIDEHKDKLHELINGYVVEALNSDDLKAQIKEGMNKKLARTLIDRAGGELEKRVNALRADPITRAKIDLAIDKIIQETN